MSIENLFMIVLRARHLPYVEAQYCDVKIRHREQNCMFKYKNLLQTDRLPYLSWFQ